MRRNRLAIGAVVFALAAPLAVAGAAAAARQTLPFMEDDYPGAMALARSKNLPIFVEAWAPW
jgi:hypothetical protein